MLSFCIEVGMKTTGEVFNFSLLEKSFTEHKIERKREKGKLKCSQKDFKKVKNSLFSI